jgi:hypothetical protein
MRMLVKRVGYLLRTALVLCAVAWAAPAAAQGADAPDVPEGRGQLFAPSAWMVLTTPVDERIAIKTYAFYVGNVGAPVAQVDVPIRVMRFLTITPSYMFSSIPASGLNKLPPQSPGFTERYDENQFRVDGTVGFSVGGFEISARNMYVRRFRESPLDDINRYRGRISVARPVTLLNHVVKPFASYEEFYERKGGWNRDRLWTGMTVPVNKRLALQPSYLRETADGNRDINYLLFGVLLNAK